MTRLLQNWARFQAERNQDAIALVMRDKRLTYGEVEQTSNRLARILRKTGCDNGDRVCLLLPKSINAVLSIHGILKAGCLYVPMDERSPGPRLARIVEQCRPQVILACADTTKQLTELLSISGVARKARIGYLEPTTPERIGFDAAFVLGDVAGESPEPGDFEPNGDGPAHILFTSGSTGTPKGVVITHGNVDAFIGWARDYFAIKPGDRTSQHSPLHFDLSTFDIFGAFSAGAELHMVPPELNVRADKLADFIRVNTLTQWFSVPSALGYMAKFDVVKFGDFPELKRLLWCGEVFRTPSLIYFMQRLPHVQFTNLYGPTETTIASSYYTVPLCPKDKDAVVPIGRPCAGEGLVILNSNLDPVQPGQSGDLYIYGAGLSPGYWESPEMTRRAFVDSPKIMKRCGRLYKTGDMARRGEDGLIYFLGRADTQIKSRGYRIELGEIEDALGTIDGLAEYAVVAIDTDSFEGATICCAYEPVNGAQVRSKTIRDVLSRSLPSYMIPTRFMAFEVLPKNANGKIDRKRLHDEFRRDGSKATTHL